MIACGLHRRCSVEVIRWMRDPQGVAPGNGIPNLHVSKRDAKDMAAYLHMLQPKLPPD
jgi:cytochrome c1